MKLFSTLSLAALFILAATFTLPQATEAQTQAGERTLAFNGITTTTRACASFPFAETAYAQIVADVTVANTSTVSLQYSANSTNFTDGGVLSASVTTDTPTVASGNIYTLTVGTKNTCIAVTPTNTNPITITAFLYAPTTAN